MLDVDCKDRTLGLSCPPPNFIELSFIKMIKQCLAPRGKINIFILHNLNFYHYFSVSGIFLLNLVCRDQAKRNNVMEILREVFVTVHVTKIKNEVNEMINCFS